MLNQQGYVCEGSGDNVFVVKDGKVLTPRFLFRGAKKALREIVLSSYVSD